MNLVAKWNFTCPYKVGQIWNYDYTGSSQTFTSPCDGIYKIELWGAQGGDMHLSYTGKGGLGAYVSGIISFDDSTKLYVNVGGAGIGYGTSGVSNFLYQGGFNGGGTCHGGASGGGGATDLRFNDNKLINRIIIASGGGGSNDTLNGGNAGGLVGYNGSGTQYGSGGSQTAGGSGRAASGSFGLGGSITYSALLGGNDCMNGDGGAGGAGYYGGGKASDCSSGGGGGSSFISGHNGCDSIDENGGHTGQSIHYSGLFFTNTIMIDGSGYDWTTVRGSYVGQPQPNGTTATGHSGNGYARITLVSID